MSNLSDDTIAKDTDQTAEARPTGRLVVLRLPAGIAPDHAGIALGVLAGFVKHEPTHELIESWAVQLDDFDALERQARDYQARERRASWRAVTKWQRDETSPGAYSIFRRFTNYYRTLVPANADASFDLPDDARPTIVRLYTAGLPWRALTGYTREAAERDDLIGEGAKFHYVTRNCWRVLREMRAEVDQLSDGTPDDEPDRRRT